MAWLDELFAKMVAMGASDLHLTSGQVPRLRLHGDLQEIADAPALEAGRLREVIYEIAPEPSREQFERENDTDFAHEIPGLARFRVNVFMDRSGPGAVCRQIPSGILTVEQLGLPRAVIEMCQLSRGLVLVTGPTGSGKSTTLAAMVDHINRTRNEHILTIEDPIEFVHSPQRCLIHQREVHRHTRSFERALEAALREDPDIVVLGEMGDLETVRIALETAEAGHLVFATLPTTTAISTVNRIIDPFPSDRRAQIRTMLASSLRGVVSQVLCRKLPEGRVPAFEILVGTHAVVTTIREGKPNQIVSAMQMGGKHGMLLLNDSLLDLVKAGLVDPTEAYSRSIRKEDMRAKLEGLGLQLDPGAASEGEDDEPSGAAAEPAASTAPRASTPSEPRAPMPARRSGYPPPSSGIPPASGARAKKGWSAPFDAFRRNRGER